jgi:hypothetical protein
MFHATVHRTPYSVLLSIVVCSLLFARKFNYVLTISCFDVKLTATSSEVVQRTDVQICSSKALTCPRLTPYYLKCMKKWVSLVAHKSVYLLRLRGDSYLTPSHHSIFVRLLTKTCSNIFSIMRLFLTEDNPAQKFGCPDFWHNLS